MADEEGTTNRRSRKEAQTESRSGEASVSSFDDAYLQLVRQLGEACYPREEVDRVSNAYISLVSVLSREGGAGVEDMTRAYADYADAVRSLGHEETARRCAGAVTSYLDALRRSWAATDPAKLSPMALMRLAHELRWAALLSASIRWTEGAAPAR